MSEDLSHYEGQKIDSNQFEKIVREKFVDYTPEDLHERNQEPRVGDVAGQRTDPDYKDAITNLVDQLEHHFYTGEPVEVDLSSPGSMGNSMGDVEIYLDETYAGEVEVGDWSIKELSNSQHPDARQAKIAVEAPIEIGENTLSSNRASARDTFVPMYDGRIGLEGEVNNMGGGELDRLIESLDSDEN